MKLKLQHLIDAIYYRIFKERMSVDVELFFQSLLYIGAGTVVSTLLYTIFTVLGGRILGPEEYGKFVQVQSIAMFLCIPMTLGLNLAMLKYVSEKNDPVRQSAIIVTTYLLVFSFTTSCIILYLFLASPISHLFAISQESYYFSIVFAALFVLYSITATCLRALNRMRAYAIFQTLYGVIVITIFLLLLNSHSVTFKTMIFPIIFTYAIITLTVFIFVLRKNIKWKFDKSLAKLLFGYSWFSLISGLSVVFYTNFDKVMVANYGSLNSLGIYNAYYVGSIGIASLLVNMITLVLFPTVSKYKDKTKIYNRMNRLIPHLIYVEIIILLICEFIFLKLFGKQYPINFIWMILAAIASICVTIQNLYFTLLSAVGVAGVRVTALGTIIIAVINVGLNISLIPRIGVAGAFLSLIISFLVSWIVSVIIGRKYLLLNEDILVPQGRQNQ
jgi:O-antigen/teichoic acid export membrane protein